MAEKKSKQKNESNSREYIIPLRVKWRKVPRYKRANKAIKSIKEFLARHMKIYDRDLNKIKLDKYLNEFVWFKGIRKPPAKIKIKALRDKTKDGTEIIYAELAELPEKLRFKKLREEKLVQTSKKTEKKAESKEETQESKTEEEIKKESEKKAAVVEAGQKRAKQNAKKEKHMSSGKTKAQTAPKRKALAK